MTTNQLAYGNLTRLIPGMLIKIVNKDVGQLYDHNTRTFLKEGTTILITKVPDYDHPEIRKNLGHLQHYGINVETGKEVHIQTRADILLCHVDVIAESP